MATPLAQGGGCAFGKGTSKAGNEPGKLASERSAQRGRRKRALAPSGYPLKKKVPVSVEAQRTWSEPGPARSRVRGGAGRGQPLLLTHGAASARPLRLMRRHG